MRTAHRSGFHPFFCDAPSKTAKECRRFLYDDKLLVFNHKDNQNKAAVLGAHGDDPDKYWREAEELIAKKM